jgi:hypothetical protein
MKVSAGLLGHMIRVFWAVVRTVMGMRVPLKGACLEQLTKHLFKRPLLVSKSDFPPGYLSSTAPGLLLSDAMWLL